jgi:hypothetical protein
MPKLFRQSSPSDLVNHEILQGFEKLPGRSVRCRRAVSEMPRIPLKQSSNHGVSMVGPFKKPTAMTQRKSDWDPLPYT